MSEQKTGGFETRVVGALARAMLQDEESHPLPESPSTGMLIARVTERIAHAAYALRQLRDKEHRVHQEEGSTAEVGIYLLGAAMYALGAIPYVDPEGDEVAPTELKDRLVAQLDERVSAAIEEDGFSTREPEDWVAATLAMLADACQGLCELQGLTPAYGPANEAWFEELDEHISDFIDLEFGDDYEIDHPEDESGDEEDGKASEQALFAELKEYLEGVDLGDGDDDVPDDVREEIADSFMSTAVMAATAAEWFVRRQEALDAEKARKRREASRRKRATQSGKRAPARKKRRT